MNFTLTFFRSEAKTTPHFRFWKEPETLRLVVSDILFVFEEFFHNMKKVFYILLYVIIIHHAFQFALLY